MSSLKRGALEQQMALMSSLNMEFAFTALLICLMNSRLDNYNPVRVHELIMRWCVLRYDSKHCSGPVYYDFTIMHQQYCVVFMSIFSQYANDGAGL